jgi:hypothetical protein
MRDRTQQRIELLAYERHAARIEVSLVEEGIALGVQMMEELIRSYDSAADVRPAATAEVAEPAPKTASRCPFSAMATGESTEVKRDAAKGLYLNEVGLMSSLEAQRKASRTGAEDGEPESN